MFAVISMVFVLLMFPVFNYLNKTVSELMVKRIESQLNYGAMQIEQTVKVMVNAGQSLSKDMRFLPLHYKEIDYDEFSFSMCNNLQRSFSSLIRTTEYISDSVLQFEEDIAFTPEHTYYRSHPFYPNYFQVNDLSYEEWQKMLSKNKNQFMKVCQIKNSNTTYEALIYVLEWKRDVYIYACVDVQDLLDLLIVNPEQEDCYITITRHNDNSVLYSNKPQSFNNYHKFNTHLKSGNLDIELFVGKTIVNQHMQTLYFFIMLYLAICIGFVLLIVIGGSYISMRPFLGLLGALENFKDISLTEPKQLSKKDCSSISMLKNLKLSKELGYVTNNILNTGNKIKQIEQTIKSQQIVLRVRFMEKALNEQLYSAEDIFQFRTLFSDFPSNGYYLILIKLWTDINNVGDVYEAPLILIASYLKKESKVTCYYEQLLSNSELLLVISKDNFAEYRQSLDFLVENINKEEACYDINCYASDCYHDISQLSTAYSQLRNMEELIFPECMNRVCIMEEGYQYPVSHVSMSNYMTLYSAILSGDCAAAKRCLYVSSRESELALKNNRISIDMIGDILHLIKKEKMSLLADCRIPGRNVYKKLETGETIESLFTSVIEDFCERIRESKVNTVNTFASKVVEYVDANYTDSNLCGAAIAGHFDCSESTIRKVFKDTTNVSLTAYIERKRMQLANELLMQPEKTIAKISVECGFNSENSFYKAYRRFYGHAPSMKKV